MSPLSDQDLAGAALRDAKQVGDLRYLARQNGGRWYGVVLTRRQALLQAARIERRIVGIASALELRAKQCADSAGAAV